MQSTILNFFAQRNRIVAHTTAGRARQCALELLVENGHVDVLENVFSKLSGLFCLFQVSFHDLSLQTLTCCIFRKFVAVGVPILGKMTCLSIT